MSETKMPKRWSVGNYDGYMVERDGGNYVEAEDVEPLVAEIKRLRAEVQEQARLLGMGGEREAKLLARVDVLERALHGIAEFCEEGDRRTFIAIANTARTALEAKP